MKVYELIALLAELPAGASVRLQPNDSGSECYELISVVDSTEEDSGSDVTVWLNGSKPQGKRS